MIREGLIVLVAFPHTDGSLSKLRPALVLRPLMPAQLDWLICMISTQLHREVRGLDELVLSGDADFAETGLKVSSLVRTSRIAIVEAGIIHGAIGRVSYERLVRVRNRLASWIETGKPPEDPG